jgi:tetratricopeptide (TPR) repeat protein
MLETIREYAVDRFARRQDAAEIHRRHAEHFLEVAERFARLGAERPLARDDHAAIEVEIDNLREARAWLREQGRAVDELRLLSALRLFFYVRGYQVEAREALNDALARGVGAPLEVRADAVTACLWLAYRAGDYAAAKARSEELMTLSAGLPDPLVRARALGELGGVAAAESDYATAKALYEQAAELLRGLGAKAQLAAVLGNLGDVALNQGELDRAERLLVESVALARETVNPDEESVSLFTLARTRLECGDPDAARVTLVDSLRVAAELGYPEVMAYCVTLAAELATPFAPELAAELAGAGEAAFERLGIPMQRLEREAHERTLASLGGRLGPQFDELRVRGHVLELDGAVATARALLEAPLAPAKLRDALCCPR